MTAERHLDAASRHPWLMIASLVTLIMAADPALATPHRHGWGGPSCTHRAALKQLVEDAFAAAPAGNFLGDGRGSGAPGYSVSLSQRGCGAFVYSVGQRDIEQGKPMTRRTRQHIGSLTKALTGTIALRLAAAGLFGPEGLNARVDAFLSAEDITALTVGNDPANPACPADIIALNRLTGAPEPVSAVCPNFSAITLRQLLNGNHGMFDFVNEVDRDGNGFLETDEYALGPLLDVLGVPRRTLPAGTETPFDLLTVYGLLTHPDAAIGGNGLADFERTFGTTGHTLFGIIAERLTGLPFDDLLALAIPQHPSSMASASSASTIPSLARVSPRVDASPAPPAKRCTSTIRSPPSSLVGIPSTPF